MIGICSIGLGIATCYGLAGLFGVKNTSMNSILPFLLLGIGIDDMFVIVQSFTNIKVRFGRAKGFLDSQCFWPLSKVLSIL